MKKEYLEYFEETALLKEYKNLSFTVILVQPEHSGNVGSIARVMANFNFPSLVLFNPIEKLEKIFSYETQGFAMHGKNILMNAEVIQPKSERSHLSEFENMLSQFDLVIATTAKGKRNSNIKRTGIFPEHFELPFSKKAMNIAILFGKESRGLTNEEIQLSDIILRIPTHNYYPTLNISHACTIILYEVFKKTHNINIGRGKHPVLLAEREDRKILLQTIGDIIQKLKVRNYKQKRVYYAFRNVLERSLITKKEVSLILGVFSKINSIFRNRNLYNED